VSQAIVAHIKVSHLINVSLMVLALLHMQHAMTNVTHQARVTYSHTVLGTSQGEFVSHLLKCQM